MVQVILLLLSCALASADQVVTRIACGSCYKPAKDSDLWSVVAAQHPQLFLFMGDTVYADTDDPDLMRKRYRELQDHPGYRAFREHTPVLATWDDHDYGRNDAGAEFPQREIAREIFLDVFEFPGDHPVRATPGIYHSWIGGPPGKRLQVILLDTRYFRSPIEKKRVERRMTYVPNTAPDATILGEAQWTWLEKQLRIPADLRLVVSSIQVLTTEHRFEKWSNIPAERQRLLDLLKTAGTRRVVLLSGDRHLAEIARLPSTASGLPYDLVELTSSGMTHAGAPEGPNRFRVGPCWTGMNFATIEIDWNRAIPMASLAIRRTDGAVVHRHEATFPR